MRNKIKVKRWELGLKQYQVASKVNISPPTLSLIEAGRYSPSEKLKSKLAKVLGCKSVTEIFPEE